MENEGYFGAAAWIFLLICLVVYLVPVWRIVSKAGFNGAFSLLSLVPIVNIVMLWVFAFIDWPVERDRTR
ncbi:MAG: hypothetical protein DIU62_001335 [Pseudomonadota bacterium]|jgi:membrane protein DedA with SNARE-associated domain|nr:MAG: hypothetical protein DIU62_02170 [Pseudomonadota bacterium]